VWERDTAQQREWQRENQRESADADAGQNRNSLKGIYVWGVQLKVTKQSDHYVWKDTSERVARRCDDTADKKRANSCVLKHLFLERVEQPKISPKKPGNAWVSAVGVHVNDCSICVLCVCVCVCGIRQCIRNHTLRVHECLIAWARQGWTINRQVFKTAC